MLRQLALAFSLSFFLNYLSLFLYAGRNSEFKFDLDHILGNIFAFIFGFFGYISRLLFSFSVELNIYPHPLVLWGALLVTMAVLYFLIR